MIRYLVTIKKLKVMKKRFLLCTAALLFTCFVLVAQSVPSEVVTAFRDGNSTGIKPFLCESVELIMLNKSQNCTAQAAENSLRDFFSSHRVLDFTVNHQVPSYILIWQLYDSGGIKKGLGIMLEVINDMQEILNTVLIFYI